MQKYLLIVGPGRRTRGGITSVIKEYEKTELWKKWNCKWIETYIDRNSYYKTYYFFKSIIIFLAVLPFARGIHIHFSEPMSAFRKSFFLRLGKFFNKPVIVHLHAYSIHTTIYGERRGLYLEFFRKADGIIVLSEFWAEQISSLVDNPEKIKILYNPFSKNLSLCKKQEKIILFAGSLNHRKGYMDLISAFAPIAEKYRDWKVILAGNGDVLKAKSMAKENGLSDQVVCPGWVTGENKDILFRSASVFCLPSYAEGFPMAVIEALSYGLPIITTPVGGIKDIFKDNENALLFEPGNVQTLRMNIEKVISSVELRNRLGRASEKLFSEHFDLTIAERNLQRYYESLV